GLWKTDGTTQGTQLIDTTIKDSNIRPAGNYIFFTQSDANGTELWRTDGTAGGAAMVKDINPGAASSTPALLTPVGNVLFFTATTSAGNELWRSDGTATGTVMVR